jgi:uncharacterized membrane protein YvlD (DUF360 family)
MKRLLRIFFLETAVLYMVHSIARGLVFEDELSGILVTGFALGAAAYLVKPLINLLILPLTIATLGLFKFLAHAVTLYIVDTALPQFSVTSFNFPGLTSQYLDLPAISFSQGPMSYLAFSLLLALISTFVHWLTK